MTANELRAELEAELAWRQEDLAFFKNQLNNISNDLEKDKYRKSLVLILYSHMEGYIKIALQTYVVLQKNLYKIGLPVDMFQQYHRDIDALVNRRNSIAHGNSRSGVTAQEFLKWESKISHVMTDITILIYDYANRKQFIQPAPA